MNSQLWNENIQVKKINNIIIDFISGDLSNKMYSYAVTHDWNSYSWCRQDTKLFPKLLLEKKKNAASKIIT